MPDEGTTSPLPVLTAVAERYPERTFYLGQVFNSTTNSYKLLWFLAILQILRREPAASLRLTDILTEMAVIAWHPVCLYRLSLGRQDKLQQTVLEIHKPSGLAAAEKPAIVRKYVNASQAAQSRLADFNRYVPTRFLAPWFQERLDGVPDVKRDQLIKKLAQESQRSLHSSLYWLDANCIRLNESWTTFLIENMAVVQAFAEHHFALYLQARNPSVPGIVNKLHAPTKRQLTAARQFWQIVRTELAREGHPQRFHDIYSRQPLGDSFTIDHFLPWSFVVHDLLWNLTPVDHFTNSSKCDALPAMEIYLPRLANLHFDSIKVARSKPKLLEDYIECFRLDKNSLLALDVEALTDKYRAVITPQAQIAANQGFQAGWVFRN